MTLGFKLGRRLIAAVAIENEQVAFSDSRFVASRRDTLSRGIPRYFDQVLQQLHPSAVFYYAPTNRHTLTEELVDLLRQAASRAHVDVVPLQKRDLVHSFGATPIRTRKELRECIAPFVPQLSEGKTHRQIAVAEAAAAALVGELRCALPEV